ncbi:hypothetical protein ACLOJK_001878 [Asimina triloba]
MRKLKCISRLPAAGSVASCFPLSLPSQAGREAEMAVTTLRATPSLSRDLPTVSKPTPLSHCLPKRSRSRSLLLSHRRKQLGIETRSELKSFENPHQWSVESERIPIFPTSSASPMAAASAASLDSSHTKRSKKICLFYCDETKDLAQRVAAESDSIELRSIAWRFGLLI